MGLIFSLLLATGLSQPVGPQLEQMTQALVTLNDRYRRASPPEQAQLLSELVTAAANRQRHLSALIETNPGEVLRLAIAEELRAQMPPQVQGYLEGWVEIEGVVEVLVEDRDPGSRYLYFLQTSTERFTLHFSSEAPGLISGNRIRVKGVRIGKAIAF